MRAPLFIHMLLLISFPSTPPHMAVYFATPPGGMTTPAERATGLAAARAALTYWSRYEPGLTTWTVEEVHAPALSLGQDTYEGGFYLVIVDNSDHPTGTDLNGHPGLGWLGQHQAMVLLEQRTGAESLPAMIAHEFGHGRYGLPDVYLRGPCRFLDIMCTPVSAYRQGVIGCSTLALLDAPCLQLYSPLVLR